MNHPFATRVLAAIGVTVLATVPFAGSAMAQDGGDAPPGNNGHIKIDDVAIDEGSENNPHPGCTFVVDFFGYDVGEQTATLTFDGQEPTGGGLLHSEEWDFTVDSRESGNELNDSRTVNLAPFLVGIEPHDQQGWHVKLTVNVTGSQGADTKHKVFWVSECPEVIAAQAAAVAVEQANVDAWVAAQAANAAQAEAAELAAAQAAAAAAAPAELPRTGALTGLLAGIAMSMIVVGALLTRSGRRQNATVS